MQLRFTSSLRVGALLGLLVCDVGIVRACALRHQYKSSIRLILNTTNSSGAHSTRIAKDPRNGQLHYLKFNGDIYRISLQPGAAPRRAPELWRRRPRDHR